MYRCEACQAVIGSGISQKRVVTILRRKIYLWPKDAKDETKRQPLPQGWEIARELKVCPACYAKHQPDPKGISAFVQRLGRPNETADHLDMRGLREEINAPKFGELPTSGLQDRRIAS